MAKTTYDGHFLSSSTNAVHSAAGMLRGFLISLKTSGSAGQVTFYDNTTQTGTILADVYVHSTSPFYVMFPRDYAPRFTTGLSITLTNATVNIWSIDFG